MRRAAAQSFYEIVLESSYDEESDGKIGLLMAAVGMVNEQFLMAPRIGGSSTKRQANVHCD
jgi:hypothetical protein